MHSYLADDPGQVAYHDYGVEDLATR
jgi:hypothetical protein